MPQQAERPTASASAGGALSPTSTSASTTGATPAAPRRTFDEDGRLYVRLNVYDVTNTPDQDTNGLVVRINNFTHPLGMGGIFHGGVEVDNTEWSFGYCDRGSGVYSCSPMKNPMYQYRSTVELGTTTKTSKQVKEILLRLRKEWQGVTYTLLSRNCCHFCEQFAQELGCASPPSWLNRFAQSADATISFTTDAMELARSVGSNVSRSAFWLRDSMAKMWAGGYPQQQEQSTAEPWSARHQCLPGSYSGRPRSTPGEAFGFGGLRFQPAPPPAESQDGGSAVGGADGAVCGHDGIVCGEPGCSHCGGGVNHEPPKPEVMSAPEDAVPSPSARQSESAGEQGFNSGHAGGFLSSGLMAQAAAAAAAAKAAAAAAAAATAARFAGTVPASAGAGQAVPGGPSKEPHLLDA